MNFVNVMHKEVYEKVATWLEAAGFDCTASKERTGFSVRFESTNIFIFIHPVREDEAYIHFHALDHRAEHGVAGPWRPCPARRAAPCAGCRRRRP